MMVNPLVTDTNALFLSEPARDLFRAPILFEQFIHGCPCLGCNSENWFRSTLQSQFMRLLWAVAALTSVVFQFAAHAGLVDANHSGNLRKRMFRFPQRINLVSLCLGKLVIGSHSAPSTWSSEKHYPTPAYLSATFKVALAS